MSQSTNTEDTMSTETQSGDTQERQDRHPAIRVFASEFRDASYQFKTEDSDRAPKYTLLPSGQRLNRVLIVGALMDVEERETDNGGFVNARVHDGDEYFYVTASRYQPDEATTLREMETPSHVAIVGKVNHWENDEGEHRIEVVPEEITQVSAEDRYEWVLETVAATRDRVQQFHNTTEQEIDAGTAPADVGMARDQYDIDPSKYLDNAEAVLNHIFLSEDE